MKKVLIGVFVLMMAILMAMTVPAKKAHKAAMMEAVEEYVSEETENILGDNILSDLSKVLTNNSLKFVIDSKLRVHNYYLFNTTSMRFNGKDQLTSIGLLGHVFTFDKEMLRERLNKTEKQQDNDEED